MTKFAVHLYPTVRVKVVGIEAGSIEEAVAKAEASDWREFEDAGAEATFLANVANGHSLASALQGVPASMNERSAGSAPRA